MGIITAVCSSLRAAPSQCCRASVSMPLAPMIGRLPAMLMVTTAVAWSSTSGRSGTSTPNCGSALVGGTTSRAIGGRIIRMPPLTAVGLVFPTLTTSGNLVHGCNMISAKPLPPFVAVCWSVWDGWPGASLSVRTRGRGSYLRAPLWSYHSWRLLCARGAPRRDDGA